MLVLLVACVMAGCVAAWIVFALYGPAAPPATPLTVPRLSAPILFRPAMAAPAMAAPAPVIAARALSAPVLGVERPTFEEIVPPKPAPIAPMRRPGYRGKLEPLPRSRVARGTAAPPPPRDRDNDTTSQFAVDERTHLD